MTRPVVVSVYPRAEADRARDTVVTLMDELIAWWPDRPKSGWAGGTFHLRWIRDTFAAADLIDTPKPRPEEPALLGAVVRAGDDVYGRCGTESPEWRLLGEDGIWCEWEDLPSDVEVLFAGAGA